MADKEYTKTEFEKTIHAPEQQAIINTPKHIKRSNVDEVGAEKGQDIDLKDVNAENVFARDEIEFSDENGDFGSNAKQKIRLLMGDHPVDTATIELTTNSGGDPIIKMAYKDAITGETLSSEVAFDKEVFEIVNNHLTLKSTEQ